MVTTQKARADDAPVGKHCILYVRSTTDYINTYEQSSCPLHARIRYFNEVIQHHSGSVDDKRGGRAQLPSPGNGKPRSYPGASAGTNPGGGYHSAASGVGPRQGDVAGVSVGGDGAEQRDGGASGVEGSLEFAIV